MTDKVFIIIRGTSGSGKSFFAKFFKSLFRSDEFYNCEADFFMTDGCHNEYKFVPERLGYCHSECKKCIESAMKINTRVVCVSNTSTTQAELRPYLLLAEKYGYTVISLIVEKRHNGENKHGVPLDVLEKQENRLRQSLKLR